MLTTIERVIEEIGDWKGKKITYEEIGGGITNKNFKVIVNGNAYVVRIPGEKTDIFIDRKNELECSIEAGKTGVAPKVVYYLKDRDVSVIEFINGKTLNAGDIEGSNFFIGLIVDAIKKVHTSARFKKNFDPFDTIRKYLAYISEYSAPIPDELEQLLGKCWAIEDTLKAGDFKIVACHNDLLSENFIYDGKKIWIIDWEYGGNCDPYFDLGDFAVEHSFTYDEERYIIERYDGNLNETSLARMFLYKIISDMWWGLWAMIQSKISDIRFDYYNYGMNRFSRLQYNLESKRFNNSIDIIK